MEDILELISDLKKIERSQRKIRKQTQEIQKQKYETMLRSGVNFELIVMYDNKNPFSKEPLKVDYIPLEGWDNANLIFNEYRRLGFKLHLHSITLNLDNKKMKKVIFKK